MVYYKKINQTQKKTIIEEKIDISYIGIEE